MTGDLVCVDCGVDNASVYVSQLCSFSVSPRARQFADGTAEESFCVDCWRERERVAAADAAVDQRKHRQPEATVRKPERPRKVRV